MIVTKRQLFIALAILLLCVLSLLGGYNIGYERAVRVTGAAIVGSNAMLHKSLLGLLEDTNIDDAKGLLNIMLDGEVIELHAYQLGLPEGELKANSIKVLIKVAEYRQKHPSKSTQFPEVDQNLQDIFREVLTNSGGKFDQTK